MKDYLPFGRPNFSETEIAAVGRIMRSGWVGMGRETILFEQELAAAVGAKHVVTVNSCTSALHLALLISGVGSGDEVICPSLTWCSTANAALYLGATPVFCDIDPHTLCLTPELVLARITPRTKAVVVVHFGGRAVDVAALRAALPPGIRIVEDAAHALGARYPDGQPIGSSGSPTCFSFYANKNLSTAEGGAVALFDDEAADRIRSFRQHGLPVDAWMRFTHAQSLLMSSALTELGYKMNYTDLQAAIGRVQLARQAEFAETRLAVAHRYTEVLAATEPPLTLQAGCTDPSHARHLFVVRLPPPLSSQRDALIVSMRAKNLGVSIHYAPLHLMPLYRGNLPPVSLPVTEQVVREIMTLPISASMTPDDAAEVAAELRAQMSSLAVGCDR